MTVSVAGRRSPSVCDAGREPGVAASSSPTSKSTPTKPRDSARTEQHAQVAAVLAADSEPGTAPSGTSPSSITPAPAPVSLSLAPSSSSIMSPLLNLDILQMILQYLPDKDLVSASYTSKLVRRLTIRELLSRPLVFRINKFDHPEQFQSWCEFVFADDRLARVRDLSLLFEGADWEDPSRFGEYYDEIYDSEAEDEEDEEAYDPETIMDRKIQKQEEIGIKRGELLLELLQRATHLRRLYIVWDESVLFAVPGIPDAISSLPTLQSFTAEPYSEEAQRSVTDVLAEMKSRLKYLSLKYVTVNAGEDSEEGAWGYDLPRALAPHLGHLEELHLGSPYGRTPRIRSTTLHTLKIPMGEGEPRPRELFEAFPNLRTLLLHHDHTCNDPFPSGLAVSFPLLRESRISEQSGGHVWPSLDTVRGELMRLYVFGLTCPVRRLEMQLYEPAQHDAAVELLRHTCPQKLVITTDHKGTSDWRTMGGKPSMLVPVSPDRPHVTHLTIRILLAGYSAKTTEGLLADLAPLLQASKIEYLRLIIGDPDMHEDYLEEAHILGGWPGAKECLLDLDPELLRDTLIGTVHSLRMLAFTIVIHGETVWMVDRSGESPTIAKVETIVPRELIRREEA